MSDYTVSKAAEKNTARFGLWTKTTDATVTAAATITTGSDRVYQVVLKVVACTEPTVTTQQASYVRIGLFKNVAGTLTLVGAVTSVSTIETDATWDCTLAASGTSIVANVTGAAATTIVWHAQVEVMIVQNYDDAFGPY